MVASSYREDDDGYLITPPKWDASKFEMKHDYEIDFEIFLKTGRLISSKVDPGYRESILRAGGMVNPSYIRAR